MATGIEWTDATWNPVTGCSKVSPGCAHCYAETVALRFWPTQYPKIPYETRTGAAGILVRGERERCFTDVMCHEDRLDQPLRWKRPRKVFVNSMSDLFHEDVPDAFIDRVFAVMALAPQHTFQILTKRAERMRDYMRAVDGPSPGVIAGAHARVTNAVYVQAGRWGVSWPWPNVWLGVSVENPPFLQRLDALMETPAAVRFVSLEPLLADVGDISRWLTCDACGHSWRFHTSGGMCQGTAAGIECYCVMPREPSLDWVIVGGESGTGARPCDLAWVRSIVAQCRAAGVPAFVKQLGTDPRDAGAERDDMGSREVWPAGWMPTVNGRRVWRPDLVDRKGGDPAEWPSDLRVREFPAVRQ
jgi:protein gp37